MTRNEARAAEVAVARLARRLAADPRLQAEVRRARREFFGSEVPTGPILRGAADTAEHRFSEWFALERESEALGVVPFELPLFAHDVLELEDSIAGVFLVLSAARGGIEARDLQDQTVFDLAVPPDSLQTGDLLVGRLFSVTSAQWTPSTAAAVFRPGAELGEAFRRDVRRLDLGRRLRQIELEHLLLRRPEQTPSPTSTPPPSAPLEHLEAELEKLLRAGGGDVSAAGVSQQLAQAGRLGPVMGPLLDQLAFETDVDLDQGRRLLLEIWNAYHGTPEAEARASSTMAPGSASSALPGETLGEQLVRTLDEGLSKKLDVDELFAELERLAGLEPGASDDEENPFDGDEEFDAHDDEHGAHRDDDDGDDGDDDDSDDGDSEDSDAAYERESTGEGTAAPAGDLGPLIQEYLWEAGREEDPAAAPLRLWVELQANAAVPNSDLEFVTATDLMRLLLHVFLGSAPAVRAASVRAAFEEIGLFYAWAERTQEIALSAVLQECQGSLLAQVDRLQAASIALSTAGTPSTRPGILQIEDLGPTGFGVLDDDGDHHWLSASEAAIATLREGDLVLGALLAPGATGAELGVQRLEGFVVVLPKDVRSLME